MEWTKVREKFCSLKNNVLSCCSAPLERTPFEFYPTTSKNHDSPGRVDVDNDRADLSSETNSRCLSTGFTLIGYTFLLQFLLHAINFLLNGLAFRHLDTTSLGLVNVRIGLFYSTLMFITRESFRRACLSRGGELVTQPASEKTNTAASESGLFRSRVSSFAELIDLTWTIVPLGAVLGSALLAVWIWILPAPSRLASAGGELKLPADVLDQRYVNCLLVYALSGLFELATESFWLVCQLTHRIRARILIEAFANTSRVIGIVLAILFVSPEYAIYSLGFPQPLEWLNLFHSYGSPDTLMVVLLIAFLTTVHMPLLVHCERYLISGFHLISFTDQGIYDLVNNLGSTAARLLFSPMEESCHFVFNQCLLRNVRPEEQNIILMRDVFRIFRTVLRTCSLVGWVGVAFAQANSCLLLSLYIGPSLAENTTAVTLLRLYSAYVLLLAWNGSTEAFLNATMSTVSLFSD
ncbi:Protein RFT1 [Fasciola hepatica]|uniref:Protein RFT1 homolog n=1 Tax=Fasciola hepatica TaxID=6192 RepID=A0A4E0RUQ7_FASHE|nr:Protein RFT1 [Fasciola hepatica]